VLDRRSLAHIEGSAYLEPRKPFLAQLSHPASVNLGAGPQSQAIVNCPVCGAMLG